MKEILKSETTQKWKPLQFLNIADQIVWFAWVFTPKKIQRKGKQKYCHVKSTTSSEQ